MHMPRRVLSALLSVTLTAGLIPVGQVAALADDGITEIGVTPSGGETQDEGVDDSSSGVTVIQDDTQVGVPVDEAPESAIAETETNGPSIIDLPEEQHDEGIEVIAPDDADAPEEVPVSEAKPTEGEVVPNEATADESVSLSVQASDVIVAFNYEANHDQSYALLGLVNQARARVGRGSLVWDADLENFALQRAAELVLYYSHTRPNGARAVSDVPGRVVGTAAENIAMMGWEGSAAEYNTSWTNSPGHYANMIESSVSCFGAAIVYCNGRSYAVEVFRSGSSSKQYRANYGTRVAHQCVTTVSPSYYKMNVSPTNMTLVPGESKEAWLSVGEGGADWPSNAIVWTSSNTSVATVATGSGALTVTGHNPGTATITGCHTANGYTVTIGVTVRTIDPTSVSLDKSSLNLKPGNGSSLTATVYPTNATDKSVTWSSSNTSVATVSTSGYVTANNVGTATITARTWNGKTATCSLRVDPIDISGARMGLLSDMEYRGSAIKPEPGVTLNGTRLSKDKDFTYSYKNNTEVGTATVTATGIGNYTGSVSSTFVIYPTKDVPVSVVWNDVNDYFGTRPTHVSLPYESSGKDTATTSFMSMGFVVTYASDGWKSSTGRLRATSYDGTAVAFDISPANVEEYTCEKSGSFDTGYTFTYTSTRLVDIADATVTGVANKTYTGKAQTQNPTVKINGITLKAGTDYTISYQNNTNAGTATVTIAGKGMFTGTKPVNFTIAKAQISQASGSVGGVVYTGKAIALKPTLTFNGATLKAGTDYTISYQNNTNAGTATAIATGKGNFTGTKQVTFAIAKAKISAATITPIATQTYTGAAIKPSVTATFNGRVLKEGTDYVLSYANNTKAGTATVTLTGEGNFEGTQLVEFTIAKVQMDRVSSYIVGERYTGKPITPKPDLTYNGITLKEGTDYTLSYRNNTNAGTATCIATGMGNFTGNLTIDFDIVRKQISSVTLAAVANRTYTGAEHKPQVTATYNGITLKAGTDYTVSYEDNVEVGTAKVILTGEGNFTGTTWVSFAIVRAKISAATVVPIGTQTYTGVAIKPSVTATFNGKTLEEGKDYTLAYTSNTKAGIAMVTLTGWGNFEDTKTVEFSIAQAPISSASFAAIESQTYTGKALTPGVTATFNGVNLRLGTDYTLSYANNTDVGTATVTVSGKGNFTGTKTLQFEIAKASVSKCTVSAISNQAYNGKLVTPKPTVKLGSLKLTLGTHYTLSYKNNTKAGTATVTIKGKGNLTGSRSVTFRIVAPSVSYYVHRQTYGWESAWSKKDGDPSGTTGESKRLEGIKIKLGSKPYSGGISYRTHIQTYGWESSWKSDGTMSGTTGESKRLEAIQIKLTGEMEKHYDVYYRVHAQRLGWMGWAKNGAQAGTAGFSYRLESIQVVLVPKGAKAPAATYKGIERQYANPFLQK